VTRPASVLVLFGEDGGEGLTVLLLERAPELRSHAGQVAFPGGARDAADHDAVATALREAAEETGLDPTGVEVIGELPSLWVPPSNFSVTPVLGWWRSPSTVYPVDPAETASVHVVPVRELLDPCSRGSVRHPSGLVGPAFWVRGLVVWGFTAGLLSRLFALAGWEIAWDASAVREL
jgi:8-oxo-dGTP pyrophosphatase MutT (NUDIX family)